MQKLLYFGIYTIILCVEINSAYKSHDKKTHDPSYFFPSSKLPLNVKSGFFLQSNNDKASRKNQTRARSAATYVKTQPNINKINKKQFDVINMIWRKTKIFMDVESYTTNYQIVKENNLRMATVTFQARNPFKLSLNISRSLTTTPSNIEFYYLHEVEDGDKRNDLSRMNFNKPVEKLKSQIRARNLVTINSSSINHKKKTHNNITPVTETNTLRDKYNARNVTRNFDASSKVDRLKSQRDEYNIESSTFYDKIKFFELHDNQTKMPPVKNKLRNLRHTMTNNRSDQETFLDSTINKVDHDHIDNKTRHIKKLRTENKNILKKLNTKTLQYNLNVIRPTTFPNLSVESRNYSDNLMKSFHVEHKSTTYEILNRYVNKSVMWTEYPFTAVYINKPSQVHCDAAGISPHWLIASGSCLSRQHSNIAGNSQSAFVIYCDNRWWLPKRVAYVKYALVHPKYHPRDPLRRQLYNIGVIQVVTSMASTCSAWAPVSLMSHQFAANVDVYTATAVGWGLDRYDPRFSSTVLPKKTLTSYESLIYTSSCLGNFEYSNNKHFYGDVGVENVYCLSLPPYNGEVNDPVHGGLLLVNGKLIAVYLQEERRPQGEQSALYTGTWRLIPWIFDVAREPDEQDIYTINV